MYVYLVVKPVLPLQGIQNAIFQIWGKVFYLVHKGGFLKKSLHLPCVYVCLKCNYQSWCSMSVFNLGGHFLSNFRAYNII